MENSNQIIPPHLNAEVYRTDTSGADLILYLDYIRLHQDGGVLIGSSDLTGRYWNGCVGVFKNISEAQTGCSSSKKSIQLASGTGDGCFIDSSKVLLCEDNGSVSIWSESNEDAWKDWSEVVSKAEHDGAALTVDCLQQDKEYVTGGADGTVKVWDISEMICVRNYLAAHNLAVYGVSVRPKSHTNFATGSLDKYVTLWDENVSKAVLDLIKNNCSIRCLQWLDENQVLFGDEAGKLAMIDTRNPNVVITISEFPAAIHKVEVHPEERKVAVCCDNKIVSVCDINDDNKSKVIYHDRHFHSNFVRGLAWDLEDTKTLHTTGWDGKMRNHQVTWD